MSITRAGREIDCRTEKRLQPKTPFRFRRLLFSVGSFLFGGGGELATEVHGFSPSAAASAGSASGCAGSWEASLVGGAGSDSAGTAHSSVGASGLV